VLPYQTGPRGKSSSRASSGSGPDGASSCWRAAVHWVSMCAHPDPQVIAAPRTPPMPAPRLVLFALLFTAPLMAQDKKKGKAPARPSDEVVKAWQKAGLQFGWHGTDKAGAMAFQDRPDGLKGAVPAFW